MRLWSGVYAIERCWIVFRAAFYVQWAFYIPFFLIREVRNKGWGV